MKLKKNDQVVVTSGRDRGRKGKIEKVFPKEKKVLVSGVNLYKKHKKKTDKNPGGIIDITRPLPVANISLICPKCNQATRVGYRIEGNRGKIRICQKCRQII
jgi:large subunit ribosomal protein L24